MGAEGVTVEQYTRHPFACSGTSGVFLVHVRVRAHVCVCVSVCVCVCVCVRARARMCGQEGGRACMHVCRGGGLGGGGERERERVKKREPEKEGRWRQTLEKDKVHSYCLH